MRVGQEGKDFVSLPIERQSVGACFRRHHFETAHGVYIDDVYDPRFSDGHVKSPQLWMQENDIRNAAKQDVTEYIT